MTWVAIPPPAGWEIVTVAASLNEVMRKIIGLSLLFDEVISGAANQNSVSIWAKAEKLEIIRQVSSKVFLSQFIWYFFGVELEYWF
jgi:hypothetical protein